MTSAFLKIAPVFSTELVLDETLRRQDRTLYQAGSLKMVGEVPLLIDHDPGRRIGTIKEFFKHKDVDGVWFCAIADVDGDSGLVRARAPVSFSFVPLHRFTVYGCELIAKALVREVSIVDALQPLEPGARVVTVDRNTGPVGEIPADGKLLIRPRVGRILSVR